MKCKNLKFKNSKKDKKKLKYKKKLKNYGFNSSIFLVKLYAKLGQEHA